jgi:hypothetical protein
MEQLPFAGYRLGHSADFHEDFVFAENQVLLIINGDVVSGVLAEQDAVTDFDVEGDAMALFHFAGANGDNFTLVGFLLGRVGDDDSTLRGFFLFQSANQDTVMQWSNIHGHFL